MKKYLRISFIIFTIVCWLLPVIGWCQYNVVNYNNYNRSASAVNGDTWRFSNHFYIKLNGVDVQLDQPPGITNSAANHEIMKSDGTNAVSSGLQSSTVGNLDLGLSGTSGSSRLLQAAGSATDVELQLSSKGSAGIRIGSASNTIVQLLIDPLTAVNAVNTTTLSSNLPETCFRVQRSPTSGTNLAGIGARMDFVLPNAANNNTKVGSRITSVATDMTNGSEDFDLVISNMANAATAAEVFRVTSTGATRVKGIQKATASKTTTYTATVADYYLGGDATSATFTITLPTATSSTGQELIIMKTDASGNTVDIDANGSETINGSTTPISLSTQWSFRKLQNVNGTAWVITGQ